MTRLILASFKSFSDMFLTSWGPKNMSKYHGRQNGHLRVKLAKYQKFWTSQSVQTGVIFVMETDYIIKRLSRFFLFERIAFNKFLVGISYCSSWKDFLKSRIELINLEHGFWHFNIINDANSECLFFLLVDLYLLLHTIIAQKKFASYRKRTNFLRFRKFLLELSPFL